MLKNQTFHGTSFNSLLPVDPLINSCYICLFLPSLLLSSFSGPLLPFSYSLRRFRSLSCCEGEAGWWWERGRARERSSLSPRCSSHLPALPWWVVCVCLCVTVRWSAGFWWQPSPWHFLFCCRVSYPHVICNVIVDTYILYYDENTWKNGCNFFYK